MEITLAKSAGFCFGVKRALKIVEEEAKKSKITILGDLIHNEYVVNALKNKGIDSAGSLDEVNSERLVISAHGVADSVKEKAKKIVKVIDATCPLVEKVHACAKDIEKNGMHVVVIGQPNHTEVKGITGNLSNYTIIENVEEVGKLKDKNIGIVVQTTQDIDKVNEIVKKIKKTAKYVKFYDTICFATKDRQTEAKEISKKVDLMIVIGSKKSSNTKRLVEVCSRNTETKHVESDNDLDKRWFKKKKKIGITAGASTPNILIENVFNKIKNY